MMKIDFNIYICFSSNIQHRFILFVRTCSKLFLLIQTKQTVRSNKSVLCIKGIFIYSIIYHHINMMAGASINQKPMYNKAGMRIIAKTRHQRRQYRSSTRYLRYGEKICCWSPTQIYAA